jgi:hypothetical protein
MGMIQGKEIIEKPLTLRHEGTKKRRKKKKREDKEEKASSSFLFVPSGLIPRTCCGCY